MKIIIAGANGFLGNYLCTYFTKKGHEVIGFVRTKGKLGNFQEVLWDGKNIDEWFVHLNGADLLINLAGKSVNCRYTKANKEKILTSRINATRVLNEAIELCDQPPKVWLNSASATIYEHSITIPNTEASNFLGNDFSPQVCKAWESEFFSKQVKGCRKVALRTAIVLQNNASVMLPFKRLVKFGFGGKMGKGNQLMSWVHVEDFARAIEFIYENEGFEKEVNIASPLPLTNATFMKKLRSWMHVPIGVCQPSWLLKFGAFLIGTEAELVLKSRYVLPGKLQNAGFKFLYPTMDDCIKAFESKK